MGQKVNMSCSTYETVHIFCVDVEVHVYSMYDLVSEDVLDHLFLHFATAVRTLRVLDSSGMPGNITIFTATYQNNFLKATKMTCFAQLE